MFFPFSSPLIYTFSICNSYSFNRITEAFLAEIRTTTTKKGFIVEHFTPLFNHKGLQKCGVVAITCQRTSPIFLKAEMEINTHYLQNKLDPVPKDDAKELDPPVWQNGSIFTILKNLPLSSQDHGLMQPWSHGLMQLFFM